MSFEKQLKAGPRKCPGHKFSTDYDHVKHNWFKCRKCGGYICEKINAKAIRIISAYIGKVKISITKKIV